MFAVSSKFISASRSFLATALLFCYYFIRATHSYASKILLT